MTDYFPASPIPEWPKRGRLGAIPIAELAALKRLDYPAPMLRASARVRSQLYRNGEPMICLSCGSHTTPDGETVCGH
jgi:hypothetical protein